MKKFMVTVISCLLIVGLTQVGLAGNGDKPSGTMNPSMQRSFSGAEIPQSILDAAGEYANDLAEGLANGVGGTPLGSPVEDGCVEVDIELPDTVEVDFGNPMGGIADGYFELINCGDEPADVMLTFELTITIEGVIDTTFTCPPFPVPMGPGEVISYDFPIPVPPFDGIYTVCVTAVSGDAQANDCATMVVVGTEFPGVPYEGYGILVDGTNCLLFAPMGTPDVMFALDNYGTFQAGDTVYVAGMLTWDCDTECVDADGCIVDNTIDGVELPGIPFSACGILVQGPDCVLFAPMGDETMLLELDNYGTFGVGDSVCVEGTLDLDCAATCADAVGCVTDNTISELPAEPPVDFSGCGILVMHEGCLLFTDMYDPMAPFFEVENLGAFGEGDTVLVTGELIAGCDSPCADVVACVVNNTIEACGGSGDGVPFNDCGVLVEGTGCMLLAPLNGPSDLFELSSYDGFAAGDTVFVAGMLYAQCEASCPEATGCIETFFVDVCTGGPGPGLQFEACGVLVQGSNCVLFSVGLGGPYDQFVLDDYGSFNVGDTVLVNGYLEMGCETECEGAFGCIIDNTIADCDFGYPEVHYNGCGVLSEGSGCMLYEPINGGPMIPSPLEISLYDGFQAGDTVFATGIIYLECTPGCPEAVACFENTAIDYCNPPSDTIPVRTCGILLQGTGCLLFAALGDPSLVATLDNYGTYGVFDTVYVDGMLILDCDPGCPEALGCITNNTIGDCTPPMRSGSSTDGYKLLNRPNPFNPTTTILLTIPRSTEVRVTVYNIMGQVVKTLADDYYQAGEIQLEWNGMDDFGNQVSSGIYFYRVETNDYTNTKKMLLVK